MEVKLGDRLFDSRNKIYGRVVCVDPLRCLYNVSWEGNARPASYHQKLLADSGFTIVSDEQHEKNTDMKDIIKRLDRIIELLER